MFYSPLKLPLAPLRNLINLFISHEYLLAKMTQKRIQIAYNLYFNKGKGFFLGLTRQKKYP